MKKEIAHNSKEIFVGGNMILVRPLHRTEAFAANTYQELVSSNIFTSLGELEHMPSGTLENFCSRDDSFVYVALSEENEPRNPLGIAIYIKNNTTQAHEMSILVSKQYTGTRLPFELADSLIHDAASHRVMTLYTVDRSYDSDMRKLADKLGMSVRLQPGNSRQMRYSLQVDEHPGIVVF